MMDQNDRYARLSETALLRASRADADAFAELYRRLAGDVHRYLAGATRDSEAARDLTAETFARVLEQRTRFRGFRSDSGRAWVFCIARNLFLEHARSKRAELRACARLGIVLGDAFASPPLDPPSPALADALRRLPDDHRDAVGLRVLGDRPFSEIAAIQNVPEATARQRVSRGLRRLQENLKQENV